MAEAYQVFRSCAISKEDGDALVNEGRTLIPSKWIDVDKDSRKSHEASYMCRR